MLLAVCILIVHAYIMDVKTKKGKGLRKRFKRTKNDERKRQAARRNTLQPLTMNIQYQSFSFDTVRTISLTRTMPEWTTTTKQDTPYSSAL